MKYQGQGRINVKGMEKFNNYTKKKKKNLKSKMLELSCIIVLLHLSFINNE